jgi:hypothetical protein
VSEADRKPWYGDGEQPWDSVKRLGWAPQFAASNVIKYLRRTKEPEHSLESARWYYARLRELADTSRYRMTAPGILAALRNELTTDEIARLEA